MLLAVRGFRRLVWVAGAVVAALVLLLVVWITAAGGTGRLGEIGDVEDALFGLERTVAAAIAERAVGEAVTAATVSNDGIKDLEDNTIVVGILTAARLNPARGSDTRESSLRADAETALDRLKAIEEAWREGSLQEYAKDAEDAVAGLAAVFEPVEDEVDRIEDLVDVQPLTTGDPGAWDEVNALFGSVAAGSSHTADAFTNAREARSVLSGALTAATNARSQAETLQRAIGAIFRVDPASSARGPRVDAAISALDRLRALVRTLDARLAAAKAKAAATQASTVAFKASLAGIETKRAAALAAYLLDPWVVAARDGAHPEAPLPGPLAGATLLTPRGGAEVVEPPVFQWTLPSGEQSRLILVGTDNSLSRDSIVDFGLLNPGERAWSALRSYPAGVYYWTVESRLPYRARFFQANRARPAVFEVPASVTIDGYETTSRRGVTVATVTVSSNSPAADVIFRVRNQKGHAVYAARTKLRGSGGVVDGQKATFAWVPSARQLGKRYTANVTLHSGGKTETRGVTVRVPK